MVHDLLIAEDQQNTQSQGAASTSSAPAATMSQAAQAAAQPPLLGLASASLSSPFGILAEEVLPFFFFFLARCCLGQVPGFTRMLNLITCCYLLPTFVSHAHTLFCPPFFPLRHLVTSMYSMAHGAVTEPSLWPLVTGIYPIPSAGSVYDDLVLFLHAFTPLITFGSNL